MKLVIVSYRTFMSHAFLTDTCDIIIVTGAGYLEFYSGPVLELGQRIIHYHYPPNLYLPLG